MSETYNFEYYHNYASNPYEDAEFWGNHFEGIADRIIADFHPQTVLDAGCAMGYLVAALRDRGVEAYGIDISEYAISQVREDVRKYCTVGSLTEELPEGFPVCFDLITNIEVLEHIYENDGVKAIGNLCKWSDRIIFSSSPDDITDPTHVNVQQPEYWVRHFAEFGFYHQVNCSVDYISSNAMYFCKKDIIPRVVEDYERERRLLLFQLKENENIGNEDIGNENIGNTDIEMHVYFDFDKGFNEVDRISIKVDYNGNFNEKIILPEACRTVRLDPVEGYGCLVWNLQVSTESDILAVKKHNGFWQNNVLAFRTIDPQIHFDIPKGSHWLNIEGRVIFVRGTGWTRLVSAIEDIEKENEDKQQELFSKEKELNSSKKTLGLMKKTLDLAEKRLTAERECSQDLRSALAEEQQTVNNLRAQAKHYETLAQSEKENSLALSNALNGVLNSKIWTCTKPFRAGCDFLRKCLSRKPLPGSELQGQTKQTQQQVPVTTSGIVRKSADPMNRITGNPIDRIQMIHSSENVKRLNLVTDTINADSLLGGVATALIVATEFVNRYDYELRIITRNTEVNPLNYENIMRISGIEPARKVSYYSDFQRHDQEVTFKLDVSPQDIFLATSWWSAKAISETTIRERFFYIIQEVETFFYNFGGEHLLCDQIMKRKDIDFIVNSSYLFQYFQKNEPNITANGCYFEPAFPKQLYQRKDFEEKTHYKLFFYARPNNPRNLFTVGVDMLDKAIERGILYTDEWDIYCVGQDVPEIIFCNGCKPIRLGQLSWTEYAKFLSDIDLGLCLMYTPHPSYPPFDVACSGGVVLSNKMFNKTSFDMCKNVILADLDEEAFLESFAEAVELAKNMEQRKQNYEANTICRDWSESLENVITYMKEKADNV